MEKLITPEVVQSVEQLQMDYVNCIDEERYQEWPEFFAEKCLYRIISRNNHRKGMTFGFMFCDSRGMVRDRIASMKSANIFEPHTYRHVLSRSTVTDGGDGTLIAKTSYIVARIMHDGAHELFSTGSYEDRIATENGKLLFKERIVVTDSGRIDALLVIPL
ncbi:MAG: terephthalate 1,2-dioxygenase [Burkholderia sp.]|jgi:anthranilate 1,2-dioxygenase small subunit|nr:terephthalate 1,2-dioxygenase [Burkholderia sp.]